MSQIVRIFFAFILLISTNSFAAEASSLHGKKFKSIGGKTMDLADYKGKPVLLVNIATQCGYTPQLEGLENLYKQYKEKGFVVLGIPSNDFGGQTPESEEGVKKFCKLNYGVSFPLTAKTVVKGSDKHPLIASLIEQSSDKAEIAWNFEKFLVDKSGRLVARFPSAVKPDDEKLKEKIASVL